MRIRITDGTGIVGGDEGHVVGSNGYFLDLAELEVALLSSDAVADEAALDVIEKTEGLVGLLFDGDDI